MSMMGEFKKFAMRGNVVDMAVGIVIGGAFGKIVSSFVADIIMPPIGIMLGGVDFAKLAITLKGGLARLPPLPSIMGNSSRPPLIFSLSLLPYSWSSKG